MDLRQTGDTMRIKNTDNEVHGILCFLTADYEQCKFQLTK